ncbi:MAG: TIR domain-containing protein [Chloroflexota bacterium]
MDSDVHNKRMLAMRHRHILNLTFGLQGARQHTIKAMAGEFGVSEKRIRMVLGQALRVLEEIGRLKSSGWPLPVQMLADSWEFEILVDAIRELRRKPGEQKHYLSIRELRTLVAPRLEELARQAKEQRQKHIADELAKHEQPAESRFLHDYEYDLALSFAGPERNLAKYVATALGQVGFRVFYDDFYAKQLWGKELTAEFDAIYRKKSRYCVIFISPSYLERMWTIFERRSAVARALEERGNEYILPIEVEPADLPGITPTIAHLSLKKYSIEDITTILREKLESVDRYRYSWLKLHGYTTSFT